MTDTAAGQLAVPVRVLTLLVLTAALAGARPGVLVTAFVLLAAVALYSRAHAWRAGCAAMRVLLKRVRWLLLAILVLYGWFMPGTPLWPAFGGWSPSADGLQEGARRASALVLIVLAVYLLLSTTGRGALVAGLIWFGRPLRRVGADTARFAVRLVLALEAVAQVQDLLTTAAAARNGEGGRVQRVGRAAATVVETALARADAADAVIEVPDAQPVPLLQWSVPLALAILLGVVAQW